MIRMKLYAIKVLSFNTTIPAYSIHSSHARNTYDPCIVMTLIAQLILTSEQIYMCACLQSLSQLLKDLLEIVKHWLSILSATVLNPVASCAAC